jgi:hypothetical protein
MSATSSANLFLTEMREMLNNDAVNCLDYTGSVTNKWNMSMKQKRNDTGKGNLKYSEKRLSQCYFLTLWFKKSNKMQQ